MTDPFYITKHDNIGMDFNDETPKDQKIFLGTEAENEVVNKVLSLIAEKSAEAVTHILIPKLVEEFKRTSDVNLSKFRVNALNRISDAIALIDNETDKLKRNMSFFDGILSLTLPVQERRNRFDDHNQFLGFLLKLRDQLNK